MRGTKMRGEAQTEDDQQYDKVEFGSGLVP